MKWSATVFSCGAAVRAVLDPKGWSSLDRVVLDPQGLVKPGACWLVQVIGCA